jgi:tetratricopeptide (TPR) repeat protein
MMSTSSLRMPYVYLLLFGLTIALFYGSLHEISVRPHAISLDDKQLMNVLSNHDLTARNLVSRQGSAGKYYRPMLTLSYLVDQRISGTASFGFRLTNVILHAANVVLLFVIARLLCASAPAGETISFLSAVLFAIHPVAVESVSWISGRTDLLAVLWSLASLFCYLSGRKTQKWQLFLGSLLFAFAAALSKENGLIVPVIIVAGELYYFAETTKGPTKGTLFFVAFCALAAICYLALRSMSLSIGDMSKRMIAQSLSNGGIWQTAKMLFASVGFYLKKFIYPYPLNPAINEINVLLYAFFGAISFLLLCLVVRKKSTPSFLAFWALLGLTPAGIVSLTSIAWTPWAERYLYFSIAPLSILTMIAFFNYASSLNVRARRILFAAGVGVMIFFAASSLNRSFFWNDDLRLWEDAYKKSPDFVYAAAGYADALVEKGRTEDAERVLLNALESRGQKHIIFFRLGHMYRHSGERTKAEEYYLKALTDARDDENLVLVGSSMRKEILLSLAGLYQSGANQDELNRENYHKAIEKMLEAHREEPSDGSLLYQIAKAYLLLGDHDNVRSYLDRFVKQGGEEHSIQAARKILKNIESNHGRQVKTALRGNEDK